MILVTGATGNVGRHVVEQLVAAGQEVRALTRRPEQAGLPDAVEVVRGDLAEPESLPAALRGIDRVFLFPVPGALPGFVAAAKEAGVRRVVLLSSLAVTHEVPNAIGDRHRECEQAATGSGLEWTLLRPGAFMANDLNWVPQIKATGVVRGLDDGVAAAPIDERDIAAVAVRALLDDGHTGEAYLLTGPEALTEPERVRVLGEALGRDLRFEPLSIEQARAAMLAHIPSEIVDAMFTLRTEAKDVDQVAPAPRDLIGRTPYTYADWAAYHADDFR